MEETTKGGRHTAGVTVGELIDQLSGFGRERELYMGGLEFYRLKDRGDVVQLEFNQQVYRDRNGKLIAHDVQAPVGARRRAAGGLASPGPCRGAALPRTRPSGRPGPSASSPRPPAGTSAPTKRQRWPRRLYGSSTHR